MTTPTNTWTTENPADKAHTELQKIATKEDKETSKATDKNKPQLGNAPLKTIVADSIAASKEPRPAGIAANTAIHATSTSGIQEAKKAKTEQKEQLKTQQIKVNKRRQAGDRHDAGNDTSH